MVYNPNQSIDVKQASSMIPTKPTGSTQYGSNIPTAISKQVQAPKPVQQAVAQPTQPEAPKKTITKSSLKKMIQRAESDGVDGRTFYKKMLGKGYDVIDDPASGFLQETGEKLKQRGQSIKRNLTTDATSKDVDFTKRQSFGDVLTGGLKDMGSKALQGFQVAGDLVGGVTDVAMEGVEAGLEEYTDLVLSSEDQEEMKSVAKKQWDTRISKMPIVQQGMSAIQATVEERNAFSEKNPETAQTIEATMNILDVATMGGGSKLAKEGIEQSVKKVGTKLDVPMNKLGGAVTGLKEGVENKIGGVAKGLVPTKETMQQAPNRVAKRLIDTKLKPTAPSNKAMKKATGGDTAEFILENNLVASSLDGIGDNNMKMVDDAFIKKFEALESYKEPVPITQRDKLMSNSIVKNAKEDIEVAYGKSFDEIMPDEIIDELKDEFAIVKNVEALAKKTTATAREKEALKSLFDVYNSHLKYDPTKKRVLSSLEKIRTGLKREIEDIGTKVGVDIKSLNQKISGGFILDKSLDQMGNRMGNRNIFGLGDTQTAILAGVLGGGPLSAVAVGGKMLIDTLGFKGGIAKKLYKRGIKNANTPTNTPRRTTARSNINSTLGNTSPTPDMVGGDIPKRLALPESIGGTPVAPGGLPQAKPNLPGKRSNQITELGNEKALRPSINTTKTPLKPKLSEAKAQPQIPESKTVQTPIKKAKKPLVEAKKPAPKKLPAKKLKVEGGIEGIVGGYPKYSKENSYLIQNRIMNELPEKELKELFDREGITKRESFDKYLRRVNQKIRPKINKVNKIKQEEVADKMFDETVMVSASKISKEFNKMVDNAPIFAGPVPPKKLPAKKTTDPMKSDNDYLKSMGATKLTPEQKIRLTKAGEKSQREHGTMILRNKEMTKILKENGAKESSTKELVDELLGKTKKPLTPKNTLGKTASRAGEKIPHSKLTRGQAEKNITRESLESIASLNTREVDEILASSDKLPIILEKMKKAEDIWSETQFKGDVSMSSIATDVYNGYADIVGKKRKGLNYDTKQARKPLTPKEVDKQKVTSTIDSTLGKTKPKMTAKTELTTEAKKYKSADEFYDAHTADSIMDLSDRSKHRFGRLIEDGVNEDTGMYMNTKVIADQYGSRGNNEFKYQRSANIPDVVSKNDPVTIYRGTVKSQKDMEPGDFVSFSKEYAGDHNVDGHIIKITVPAKDVVWQGADLHERIYSPEKLRGEKYEGGLVKIREEANKKGLKPKK